jgi:glutathione S-transferase
MGGPAGIAMTNFVQAWSNSQIHPAVAKVVLFDIYEMLDEPSKVLFRKKREAMFGTSLEAIHESRNDKVGLLGAALAPMEIHLKTAPYLGGVQPIFADYILFGALQWARMCATVDIIPHQGNVADWFNRLLDMYDGMGRKASPRI